MNRERSFCNNLNTKAEVVMSAEVVKEWIEEDEEFQ